MTKLMFSLMATLLAAVGLAPAPAHADVQNIATAPMVRVGVDHAVAAAHGYEIRTDDRGVEYAVRPGTPPGEGYADGVCGRSWVDFTNINQATHTTDIHTGFELKPGLAGAVFVFWKVSVIDHYGASVKDSEGFADNPYRWEKEHFFKAKGPTWAYADVMWGSGAMLWDGTYCYSHNPTDRKWL